MALPSSTTTLIFLIALILLSHKTLPVTHWTKNDQGLVVPVTDSYFAIKNIPGKNENHLSDFLDQIEEFNDLKVKKQYLQDQKESIEQNKDVINSKESTHEEIERQHYKNEKDCVKANRKMEHMSFLIPLAINHYIPYPLLRNTRIKPIWTRRNNTHNSFHKDDNEVLVPYCHIIFPDEKIPPELLLDYSDFEFEDINTYGVSMVNMHMFDTRVKGFADLGQKETEDIMRKLDKNKPKRDEILLQIELALENVEFKEENQNHQHQSKSSKSSKSSKCNKQTKNDDEASQPLTKYHLKKVFKRLAEGFFMQKEFHEEHLAHSLTIAITREPIAKQTWVLYDLAALYWRLKGDPINALQCIKRAHVFAKLSNPQFINFMKMKMDRDESVRDLWKHRLLPKDEDFVDSDFDRLYVQYVKNFPQARIYPIFQLSQVMVHYDKNSNFYGHFKSEQYNLVTNATRYLTKSYHISEIEIPDHPSDFFNLMIYSLSNMHLYLQSQRKALELLEKIDLSYTYNGVIVYNNKVDKLKAAIRCGQSLLEKLDKQKAALEKTLKILQSYKGNFQDYKDRVDKIKTIKVDRLLQQNAHVKYTQRMYTTELNRINTMHVHQCTNESKITYENIKHGGSHTVSDGKSNGGKGPVIKTGKVPVNEMIVWCKPMSTSEENKVDPLEFDFQLWNKDSSDDLSSSNFRERKSIHQSSDTDQSSSGSCQSLESVLDDTIIEEDIDLIAKTYFDDQGMIKIEALEELKALGDEIADTTKRVQEASRRLKIDLDFSKTGSGSKSIEEIVDLAQKKTVEYLEAVGSIRGGKVLGGGMKKPRIVKESSKTILKFEEDGDHEEENGDSIGEGSNDSDEDAGNQDDDDEEDDDDQYEDASDEPFHWKSHAWPTLQLCKENVTKTNINNFPPPIVEYKDRNIEESTIYQESLKYFIDSSKKSNSNFNFSDSENFINYQNEHEEHNLATEEELLDSAIGSPQPYCDKLVDLPDFLDHEIIIKLNQLQSITEGLIIPNYFEMKSLLNDPETKEHVKKRVRKLAEKDLWLISKLITVLLPPEKKTMSGLMGPRIHYALKQSYSQYSENKGKYKNDVWKVLNMAAIFWRVHGGPNEALNCLLRAIVLAPDEHRDIPMIHLADFVYRMGYISDSFLILSDVKKSVGTEEAAWYLAGVLRSVSFRILMTHFPLR